MHLCYVLWQSSADTSAGEQSAAFEGRTSDGQGIFTEHFSTEGRAAERKRGAWFVAVFLTILWLFFTSCECGCDNVLSCIGLSVCFSVCVCPDCALTFESPNLETWLWVCKYIFRISRPSSYVKVIGSRSRWQEQTRAHHGDEIPERDVTYHLTCLLIYHWTTTHL